MLHKSITPLASCQLKFASDNEWRFEAYLSKFNGNDRVGDTILPGAYSKSLSVTDEYPLFINHEHKDIPVGRLKAREDDQGLRVTGDINPDHHLGKSAYTAMKRGDINAMSIGYQLSPQGWEKKRDGKGRILKEVDLKEGSIVTFPCDQSALIFAVKSDIGDLDTIRDLEHYLRDAWNGDKSAAIAWMGRYRDVLMRDAERKSLETSEQQTAQEVFAALQKLSQRIK